MRSTGESDRRVIFVHGMGPKPPRARHRQEWLDGLRHSLWAPLPDETATMAYWADLRSRRPLRFRIRAGLLNVFRSRLMKAFARDFYLYFHTNLGKDIRQQLQKELRAAAGKRIAILSHSMGAVIAYDVLIRSPVKVELLITMGSPLGLPPIHRELKRAAFPSGLHRWLNTFDGMDPVTLPVQEIGGIYTRDGAHLVIDRMIRENHSPKGKRDAHHWFGYLTCQEVGDALSQFLIAP
ncbi:MAG: hypothetical protein ACE5KW_02590 [Dehalococcoidia bacterium]